MIHIRKVSRSWRLLAAATVLAAVFGTPAASAPAFGIDPVTPPVPPVVFDEDARPVLDWSVPGRWSASWKAWRTASATYDRDFINPPSGWTMTLDACASTSVRRITGFTFTLTQAGGTWGRTRTTSACKLTFRDMLPAQGSYLATLTLRTDFGAGAVGVSPVLRTAVRVRDRLIVSIGDSLASGEGAPDVPGDYTVDYNVLGKGTVTDVDDEVTWKDTRCHRSAKSGPALAAKAFENRHTSVTFLSFACSGAEIRHLITDRHRGIQRSGTLRLPPQLDAVRDAIRSRRIDSLLVSVGLNDLDFAGIIRRCAANPNVGDHIDCVTDGGIAEKLTGLPLKYADLAGALRQKLPDTREVYFNTYPANLFRGGACGSLRLRGVGIDAAEGQEMQRWGEALGHKITKMTHMFRGSGFRWNLVGDLDRPFYSHRYCAGGGQSWFTKYERSLETQGNDKGTAHPNAAGHVAYGNILRRAMVPDQGAQFYRRLTVKVHAVKKSGPSGDVLNLGLTMWRYQNDPTGVTRFLSVPADGRWTPIPAASGTLSLDVFREPASPRHAVRLSMLLGHILPIRHTLDDAYGAGTHTVTHPSRGLSILYTVTVTPPPLDGSVIG